MTFAMWVWLVVGVASFAGFWAHCFAARSHIQAEDHHWTHGSYKMASDLAVGVGVLLFVTSIVATLVWTIGYADKVSCERHAAGLGVDSRWTFLGGCLMERRPGRYVPEGDWNMTELYGDLTIREGE